MWAATLMLMILVVTAGGNGGNISFLLGTPDSVMMVNTSVDSFATITNTPSVVYSLDYHLERNLVYYYCDGNLYKSTLFSTNESVPALPTIVGETNYCRGFAVDWVHDVIYWADCKGTLMLMDLEGKKITTVIENLHHRRLIKRVEVDPEVGKVFWVADGTLECSDLTGDNLRTNLSAPDVDVTAFTLDTRTSRLVYVGYFNSSSYIYEMSYNSNGTGSTKRSRSLPLEDVTSLGILDDTIYWAKNDQPRGAIYRQTRNTTTQPELIQSVDTYVWHMRVVDPELQRPSSGDPCRRAECSHICVHQGEMARCLCPDGMILDTNTTCFGEGERNVSFLLGTSQGVSMFSTSMVNSMTTVYPTFIVKAVDYHLRHNLVYFLVDKTLYKFLTSSLLPERPPLPLNPSQVRNMSYCEGFAVDWVHDVIYWMDCSTNSLMLMDLEGNNVTTILGRPGDQTLVQRMEVDPEEGKVIWTANGTLEGCDLTGDNFRSNLSEPGVCVEVFTLDIPQSRLFYMQSSILYEMSYSSTDAFGTTRQTPSPYPAHVTGLVVLGDYLYCVRHYYPRHLIYRLLTIMRGLPVPIARIEKAISHMRVMDTELQKPFSGDPCRHSSCSHFCVHQSRVARCLCPDGMTLVGNTTCYAPILVTPYEDGEQSSATPGLDTTLYSEDVDPTTLPPLS